MMIMPGEVYLQSSTPAAVALNFAEHNAAVQNAEGGVGHARLNWIGHIHYEGNDGWASFEMYVTAARTSGTMDITLQRQRGRLVTHSGRIVKITAPEKRTDQPRVVN